jgi:hypothetical protein
LTGIFVLAILDAVCDSRIMVITRASQARDASSILVCRLPEDSLDTKWVFVLSALFNVA